MERVINKALITSFTSKVETNIIIILNLRTKIEMSFYKSLGRSERLIKYYSQCGSSLLIALKVKLKL